MNKKQENLIIIGVTLLWIIALTGLNMIPASTPDLSNPPGPPPTTSAQPPTSTETPTQTTTVTTSNNENPITPRGLDLVYLSVKIAFFILLSIIAYFLYKFIMANYQGIKIRTSHEKEATMQQNIFSLENASQSAEQILKEALKTREYTKAVIEAYHVLDKELTYFRNAARPKHWTPKEYAYRVKDPVNQDAVKGIVEIFYKVRYAKKPATKQDVLDFLLFLKGIFKKNLTKELQQQIKAKLPAKTEETLQEIIIPRVLDFTKPFKTPYYGEKKELL